MGKYFVFSSNPAEREFLFNLAHPLGVVYTSPTIEKAAALLASSSFDLAIVEAAAAGCLPRSELLLKVPCLLLVGSQEDLLKEAVRRYPATVSSITSSSPEMPTTVSGPGAS